MQKAKNHYIKYTRAELENYTKHDESCVQKINCVEAIRFSPTIMVDFQSSILRILSRKIGRYDVKLNGVVLDFRNTKILSSQAGIRQDSAFSLINVETNFYVFSPRKGAMVTGAVKYINRLSMETVISVVIYRVFNVKVTVRGKVKQELEKNQEIQIRVKNFHFDNVIPYIEGEVVDTGILFKGSKKLFEDGADSGISESSVTSETPKEEPEPGPSAIRIKQERESSAESSRRSPKKSSRKRKSSNDSTTAPSLKRVKSEPVTSSDEEMPLPRKVESSSDSDDSLPPSQPSSRKKTKKPAQALTAIRIKEEPVDTSSSQVKEKKSKKKKKRDRFVDDEDDFERSLQNLLDSSRIKKEK